MFALFVVIVTATALAMVGPETSLPPIVSAAVAKEPAPPEPEAPYIELPAEKKVRANRYFCLRPKTNCKTIKWIIPDGLEKLDPEIPIKDTNAVVLIGDNGAYKVQAYGALGDQVSDIATCTVIVGPPKPPTPPTPPTPPVPSALQKALQDAYTTDKDADRAASLEFLQSVYEGMATQAPAWTTVKTVADASAQIRKGIDRSATNPVGLSAAQVINLRKAIQAEMVSRFGATPTTPIDLTALATELATIGSALKGVK